jgi:ABC-type branched-subunit amino acid transport system ATPase component
MNSDGAMIALEGAIKRFGTVVALDAVDLRIAPGSFTGLVGPNGSGKTTLFDVLSGFVHLDGGGLRVNGRSVARPKPYQLARAGIARTFQDCRLWLDMSAHDNVKMALPEWRCAALSLPRSRVLELTRARGLFEEVGLDIVRADVPAAQLSLVERRRVELARALAARPGVLLLDEIAAGLDPIASRGLYGVLRDIRHRRPELAIVAIEHKLDLLQEFAERMLQMNAGRLSRKTRREAADEPA